MASADQLIEVFNEAKARPAGVERDQYLAEACKGEPALKEQVLALLAAHAQAGNFLHTQLLPAVPALTEKPGDRIGRYKLLEQIGEGGCGVVYMAEQEEPVRRRVALKVIKLGMDTKQVVARFEAERQALALMDHPNIAKVLDAGATETGRPYFVMELVRGVKITDYCDQHNLSTEDRLVLFTQVCNAIQHAHQKGIIHRDIKPSNILVTRDETVAIPKVIDFGIAKATSDQRLTDKTVFTAFEQFLGTPAYMSPEQAMMTSLDIDTRTDIYALGVLLYELLTGQTPFDARELMSAGLDAMRQIIREQEPARPSTRLSTMQMADLTRVAQHRQVEPARLGTLLQGDLDWIVMKALEKDRTRRYETANGLAADIKRHLANEPVIARPPSNLYRLQKLVGRNRVVFVAGSAAILALFVAATLSTWMFINEKRARERATAAEMDQRRLRQQAEVELAESRRLATYLGKLSQDLRSVPGATGADSAYREWMGMCLRLFSKEYPEAEEVLTSLAQALQQGLPTKSDPLPRVAMEKCHAAMALFESAVSDNRRIEESWYFANGYENLGQLFAEIGESGLTEQAYRDTQPLWEKMVAATSREDHRFHLAINHNLLGDLLRQSGRHSEALDQYRKGLPIWTNLVAEFNLEHHRMHLANNCRSSGEALSAIGQPEAAKDSYAGAQTIWNKLVADFDNAYYRNERFENMMKLVAAVEAAGNSLEAEAIWREELARCRKVHGTNSLETADALGRLAEFLGAHKQFPEAESMIRESLQIRRDFLGNDHRDVATTLHKLAILLRDTGRLSEAEELYREALALRRKLSGNGDEDLGHALHLLAWTLHLEGRDKEAEILSREELVLRRKLFGNEHNEVAWTLQDLTIYLRDQNRLPEAETMASEALAIRKKVLGAAHPQTAESLRILVDLLKREGKLNMAEAALREALALQRKPTGNEEPELVNTLRSLGDLLRASGKWTESEAALSESVRIRRKLFGNESLDLGHALHALAWVLNHNGKHAEAEALSREELAIRKKQLGEDHPEVAATVNDLIAFLRDGGKLLEAETMAREALASRRKALGVAHSGTDEAALRGIDDALSSLAMVLLEEGKLAEAEAVRREELALEIKLSGEEHLFVANSLSLLAGVLTESGNLAEAEANYREAIAMCKKLLGNAHPDVAPLQAHLSTVLLAEEKFDAAEAVARECLAIRERVIPEDWKRFNAQSLLGGSLLGQKKYAEAEPLLLSGYEGMKQRKDSIPAGGKLRVKETLQRLIQLYEATGPKEKAVEWTETLAEFDRTEADKKTIALKP